MKRLINELLEYSPREKIIFIDPSGGPMINLGDKELIKGEEIVGIYTENEKIIIRTKNII